jgi:hypothetical protein
LTGQPLEQVLTPVNIDQAEGVRGAEIRLSYDTSVLSLDQSAVTAGTVWSGAAEQVETVVNVDHAAGTAVVFVFTPAALPSASGTLVEFRFTVLAAATIGSSTVIDLARVRLNEGLIPVDPAPQPGADVTDGRIMVEAPMANAVVSGFLFADTNGNQQPDVLEGLANFVVILVDSSGARRETRTAVDGQYQFADLPPGSYTLQAPQSAAYLNGGPDEIAVELESGENLANQNFRELGLRPEFVYSRLFTTLVMPVGSNPWMAALARIHADAESVAGGTMGTQAIAQGASREIPEGTGSQSLVAQPPSESASAAEGESASTVAGVLPPTTAGEVRLHFPGRQSFRIHSVAALATSGPETTGFSHSLGVAIETGPIPSPHDCDETSPAASVPRTTAAAHADTAQDRHLSLSDPLFATGDALSSPAPISQASSASESSDSVLARLEELSGAIELGAFTDEPGS